MHRWLIGLTVAVTAPFVVPAWAQQNVPQIPYESVPNFLKLPPDMHLGEATGVAVNSKGHVFVYSRSGSSLGPAYGNAASQLLEFMPDGKFVREIGKNSYGFMFAAQVRIDPNDNIWVVDQMTNMVIKFDPQGHLAMLLGRKAEALNVPAREPAGDGAGQQTDLFNRPTDVAWDAAGNIFVADGLGNARIAKFDKDGKFVKSWGKKGTATGEFANVRSIAVDAQGNVYAADGGNKRVEVFDNNGTFKTAFTNVGNAQALCMTKGSSPFLYVSNSNPPNDIDRDGEIYKMRLDGTMMGKFGKAGKLPKEFGTVNAIDCSNENTLYVGEVGNLRVQKLMLH